MFVGVVFFIVFKYMRCIFSLCTIMDLLPQIDSNCMVEMLRC